MRVFIFILLIVQTMYAQESIRSITSDASLDVFIIDKTYPQTINGFLLPKINYSPTSNPGVNQEEILVYLSLTVGVHTPGFCNWEKLYLNKLMCDGNVKPRINYSGIKPQPIARGISCYELV